jgi:hypothetical protein
MYRPAYSDYIYDYVYIINALPPHAAEFSSYLVDDLSTDEVSRCETPEPLLIHQT